MVLKMNMLSKKYINVDKTLLLPSGSSIKNSFKFNFKKKNST